MGFFLTKNPKFTSYRPGATVTMYDLSRSHLKLSGSVLTLCTFHGTPFPLFTCPLFQIHRPKLLSPTRPRFINAWDLR